MSGDGISRRQFVTAAGAATVTGLAGCSETGGATTDTASSSDTIKIGVLEDQSGNFALNGTPKYRASMLAIQEINNDGGIDGKQIEPVTRDPQSDNQRYQELTRQFINEENVDALWAGYSSATREAIRPIINRHEQLYFYTTQYEGGVCDKTTFAMGPTARQQLGAVLPYLREEYGPEIYVIAADYNFGQLSADWVEVLADEHDAEIVADPEFIPLSESSFGSVINNIQDADPDFVMSMLVGANHTSFYEQKASAGLEIPIGTSTAMAQGYEHKRIDPPAMANIYAGVNYMEEGGCHRKPHTRGRRVLELCLRAPAPCKKRVLSTSSSMSWLPRRSRCSSILSSTFSASSTCSPPLAGGEHETTTHQNSSERSSTATTRTSTAFARSHENSRTRSSGSAVASIDRPQETRSIASSPTSNTSSTKSSTTSSSRPPPAACST